MRDHSSINSTPIKINSFSFSHHHHQYSNGSSFQMSYNNNHTAFESSNAYNTHMKTLNRISLVSQVSLADYDNTIHQKYISLRKNEINYLADVIQCFKCDLRILYKAINYLDRLFIETPCQYNVREMAIICLSLSMKYNGNTSSIQNKIKELCLELNRSIDNYQQKEIDCLHYLNYDLNKLCSYDFIEELFQCDTIGNQIEDINVVHLNCLELYNEMIIDDRVIDFTSAELSFSIMKIILYDEFNCLSLEQFIKTSLNIMKENNIFSINIIRCCFVIRAICFNDTNSSSKRRNSQALTASSSSTNDSK